MNNSRDLFRRCVAVPTFCLILPANAQAPVEWQPADVRPIEKARKAQPANTPKRALGAAQEAPPPKPLTPEQQEALRRQEIMTLMCNKSFTGNCEFQGKR